MNKQSLSTTTTLPLESAQEEGYLMAGNDKASKLELMNRKINLLKLQLERKREFVHVGDVQVQHQNPKTMKMSYANRSNDNDLNINGSEEFSEQEEDNDKSNSQPGLEEWPEIEELEEAQKNLKEAREERLAAQKEREEARKERLEAQKDRENARQERQKAQSERIEARNERLKAKQERNDCRLKRLESQQKRQEARQQRLQTEMELQEAHIERKETSTQITESQQDIVEVRVEIGEAEREREASRREAKEAIGEQIEERLERSEVFQERRELLNIQNIHIKVEDYFLDSDGEEKVEKFVDELELIGETGVVDSNSKTKSFGLEGLSADLCETVLGNHTYQNEKHEFRCPDCGNGYNKRSSYLRHAKTHSSAEHECYICKKMFVRVDVLRRHIKNMHGEISEDFV